MSPSAAPPAIGPAAKQIEADPRAARAAALAALRAAPVASAAFLGRAWAAIFVVETSLRVVGYKRTVAWIEGVPAKPPGRAGAPVALGERLVRGAYRAHLFAGSCLPRSLVQYLLHRRDGTPARFVVGVRRAAEPARSSGAASAAGRGIEAHAWVESLEALEPAGSIAPSPPGAAEKFVPIFQSGDSEAAAGMPA